MNQGITLSGNIFKYLYEEIRSFGSICKVIEQNIILVDEKKKLPMEYVRVIDSLEDNKTKEDIKKIFDEWVNNHIRFINVNKYNYEKNKDFLDVVVCNESEDKILFEPFEREYNEKKLKIKFKFGDKIEIHNANSFLSPEHYHRLKNIPTEINLKKGDKYDLAKILTPFLKEAEKIEFHDPYLINRTATENLKRILEVCKKTKEIVIKLDPTKIESDTNKFEDFKKRLSAYSELIKYGYYPVKIKRDGTKFIGHQER